jgi:hypothetical protein
VERRVEREVEWRGGEGSGEGEWQEIYSLLNKTTLIPFCRRMRAYSVCGMAYVRTFTFARSVVTHDTRVRECVCVSACA